MSDTLLATTLTEVARRIGERLPAAYSMEPGEVLVDGDADSHAMPEGAPAVRWALGEDDGFLILAVTPDAAEMLCEGPPESSLGEALSVIVADMTMPLAALFDGIPPMLGAPEELDAADVLVSGPGDAVSVPLDDGGIHRATVGLRMVISDSLLQSAPEIPDVPADDEDADQVADELTDEELTDAGGPPAADAEPHELAQDDLADAADHGFAGMPAGAPSLVGTSRSASRRGSAAPSPVHSATGNAHPADFASFDQLASMPGRPHSMSLLGDVELGVTAELGRTELTVRDVLGLTPGSIIELDRAAGSPVDVVVNGTLIARGEVVVIDEEFGIRITEILGMADEVNPFPMAQ